MTNSANCSGTADSQGAAPAGGSCKGDMGSCKGEAGKCMHDCANCTAGKCETHGCGMGKCSGEAAKCSGTK